MKHTVANRQKLGLASLVLNGKTTLKGKAYVEYTEYSIFMYRMQYELGVKKVISDTLCNR